MSSWSISDIVSKSEARLLFWLIAGALIAIIWALVSGPLSVLAPAAIILFIAWLMAYVVDPIISWLRAHLAFRGRGIATAIVYVATVAVAFLVLLAAGVALLNAASAFVANLPQIIQKVVELLRPLLESLGISLPSGEDAASAIGRFLQENGEQLADAVVSAIGGAIALVASLFTAVVISVGIAIGQLSLLGWARRFLPEDTYSDLEGLEQAIAISFGGFVRGRLAIGAIFGCIIAVAAIVFGIPYAALIGVIAGLIVFIPWIGPLLGWAVLPAFALVLAPDMLVPSLIASLVTAAAVQVVVTQLVMGEAVHMSPVAVFAVVIIGTTVAGVAGAIFAIPTAAAILSITDYLRRRDVLVHSGAAAASTAAASTAPAVADPGHAGGAPGAPRGSLGDRGADES